MPLIKNHQKVILVVGGLLLLVFIVYFYSVFRKKVTNPDMTGLLIIGLILGAVITFLIVKVTSGQKKSVVKESTHTVIESIRKVFKIVCAEGQLNELYDFEETKKFFGIIPSTKRALVIIEAKVLIGYDFEKC